MTSPTTRTRWLGWLLPALVAVVAYGVGEIHGLLGQGPVVSALRWSYNAPGFKPPPPMAMPDPEVNGLRQLTRYPGKIEVACPAQDRGTAVILIAGQSNGANTGGERFVARHKGQVLNFHDGRCYEAASPLLGAQGTTGEMWTPMADALVDSGAFDKVILIPTNIGGTWASEWAPGGILHAPTLATVRAVSQRYRITHTLWLQGESDALGGTDPGAYRDAVTGFAEALRAGGADAPFHVALATRCGTEWTAENPIRNAQRGLAGSHLWLKAGPDLDMVVGPEDRYDACHIGGRGLEKAASSWAAIIGAKASASR